MTEPQMSGPALLHAPKAKRLLRIDEWCRTATAPSLVEGLLPEACFAMVFGPSGAGKTFVALELAVAVALGQAWHGKRVRQGAVVYVAAEGQEGLKKRVRALMKHRGIEDIPELVILPSAIDLGNHASVEELVRELSQLPQTPKLVIIDTFGQCYSGDENNHEVTAPLQQINLLGERGIGVLLIHHSPKGRPGDERGSTRIKAAADVMINVQQDRGIVQVSCAKSKDYEPFRPLAFRLLSVDLGMSSEGEPTSSAVLCPYSMEATSPQSSQRYSNLDEAVLAALQKSKEPMKSGAWQASVIDPSTSAPVTRDVFQKSRQRLVKAGVVRDLGRSRYEPLSE